MQDTSHEDKNNEGEDDKTSKIADESIPGEDIHNPHIKSKPEQWIYNLRLRKPRNNPGVDDYAHAQIVHYVMMQY